MKRIVAIVFSLLILVSCRRSPLENTISRFQEKMDEFNNYTCTYTLIVNSKEKSTSYLIEERFVKPDYINIRILEPKESQGFTITYEGNKVYIKHPSIEQSISIESIKTLNRNLSMGNILENIEVLDESMVEMEEIEGEEYIVLIVGLGEKNKYRNTQKIWIKKKDFIPHKSNIFDEEGNIYLEIYYQNFQYDVL